MSCEVEDPCGSCSTCKDERVGAAELMDEYWFYHNMLDRARIFKPSTDACCSSTNKEMLLKDKHGGLQSPPRNLPKHDNPSNAPNFLRTPSLPPCIGKEKSIQCEEINGRSSTNSRLQRSFSSVANAPSPPPIANSHCSSSSKMGKAYVVFRGRRPGIYFTWEACNAQVDGFHRALFQSYKSQELAVRAWEAFHAKPQHPEMPNREFPPQTGDDDSAVIHQAMNSPEIEVNHISRHDTLYNGASTSNPPPLKAENRSNEDDGTALLFLLGVLIVIMAVHLISLNH